MRQPSLRVRVSRHGISIKGRNKAVLAYLRLLAQKERQCQK